MPSFSNQKIDAAMVFGGSSIFANQSSDPPYGWARTKIWQSAPLNFLSSRGKHTKIATSLGEMEELYHTWNPSNTKSDAAIEPPSNTQFRNQSGIGRQRKKVWFCLNWSYNLLTWIIRGNSKNYRSALSPVPSPPFSEIVSDLVKHTPNPPNITVISCSVWNFAFYKNTSIPFWF